MKKIIGAIVIGFAGLVAANEYFTSSSMPPMATSESSKEQAVVIKDFKEGYHYKVIDTSSVTDVLKQLGVTDGQSFEIFSYSCGHCFMFEAMSDRLEYETGVTIEKFQLGFNHFPVAEADYYLKKSFDGKKLAQARKDFYSLMFDQSISSDEKAENVKLFPHSQAISEEEIAYMRPFAEKYRDLTRKLAIDLNIAGTPAIYLFGKYEIQLENINTYENLLALTKYLKKIENSGITKKH